MMEYETLYVPHHLNFEFGVPFSTASSHHCLCQRLYLSGTIFISSTSI